MSRGHPHWPCSEWSCSRSLSCTRRPPSTPALWRRRREKKRNRCRLPGTRSSTRENCRRTKGGARGVWKKGNNFRNSSNVERMFSSELSLTKKLPWPNKHLPWPFFRLLACLGVEVRRYFLQYSNFARKDLRFGGPELVSCSGRHLTSLPPWSAATPTMVRKKHIRIWKT